MTPSAGYFRSDHCRWRTLETPSFAFRSSGSGHSVSVLKSALVRRCPLNSAIARGGRGLLRQATAAVGVARDAGRIAGRVTAMDLIRAQNFIEMTERARRGRAGARPP